jgi:hypothetical protein
LAVEDKHRVPEAVRDAVRRAEEALITDKSKAREYYKLYMGIAPKKRKKRSNLFIRKIFALVENATARWVEAMFQFSPYFDLESRSKNNVQRADNAEKVLQYNLESAQFVLKCIDWFKASAISNLGVAKLGWKRVVRKQKQRMPLDEAMAQIPNFKLPKDLEDIHVFIGPGGEVYTGDDGAMHVHQGEEMGTDEQLIISEGYQPVTLDMAPQEVQQAFTVVADAPKVLYDGLELTPIDLEDMFFDPDANNAEELRFAGHHCGKTLADLKAEKKSGVPYKNLDKLEEYARGSGATNLARYKRRADLGKSASSEWSEFHTLFRVTEFWDVQEGKLYTFVGAGDSDGGWGDGIVIRDEDIPYWHGELPYHFIPGTAVPFEMVGVGVAELAEHLQVEKNEIRNLLMDLKVIGIRPPWLYDENAIDDTSRLRNLEPDALIPVNTQDKRLDDVIKPVIINPAAFQNATILENAIDRDTEEVTGITKANQGIPIGRRTTYSEQSMLANEGNYRFKLQIRYIDAVFKRLARQSLRLLDQFVDPVVEIRVTGDDANPAFAEVDRADLSFEYDIYPASSSVESLANALSKAQNMIQGYAAVRGTAMEGFMKPAPFLREYFRNLGIKDVQRFVKSDDEIQQEQAQPQAQQAQMGQDPGGMPGQSQPQAQPQQGVPDEFALIQQEHDLLMQGQSPPVTPEQNHQQHLEGHEILRQQLEEEMMAAQMSPEDAMNDPRVYALALHMEEHMAMMGGTMGEQPQAGVGGTGQAQEGYGGDNPDRGMGRFPG